MTAVPVPVKVRVRMYQIGFGDCFLVTIEYATTGPDGRAERHILFDLGSTRAPRKGAATMKDVADLVAQHTNGQLDVVVITHRQRSSIRIRRSRRLRHAGSPIPEAGTSSVDRRPEYLRQPDGTVIDIRNGCRLTAVRRTAVRRAGRGRPPHRAAGPRTSSPARTARGRVGPAAQPRSHRNAGRDGRRSPRTIPACWQHIETGQNRPRNDRHGARASNDQAVPKGGRTSQP